MAFVRTIFPYKDRQNYLSSHTNSIQDYVLLSLNYSETSALRLRLAVAFKHHITDRFPF